MGQGAATADIFTRQSPEIRLLIAKVFFKKLSCTPLQIAAAIHWQIERGAQLINMSFGLHADRPVLRKACESALQAGLVLVASSPARGDPVYPAHYPGVIRATGDARCNQGEISYLNSPQADFGGYVRAEKAAIAGASVGCAYVTASVIHVLLENPHLSRASLITHLAANAIYSGPENRTHRVSSHCDE